jgi:hypothetical protein
VPDARALVPVAGLDDVLRTGKCHHAVDHRQLAMVAQIEPGERNSPKRGGQNRKNAHALLAQRRGQIVKELSRADRVGQHAAHHPAMGRADQCLGHALAHAIVLEDIEQQMHVLPGGVDVGNQPLDDFVRVGHQRERIAGHHRQPAHVLGQMHQHVVVVLVGIDHVMRFHLRIGGGSELRAAALTPGQSLAAQPVLADQQVEPQSDPRLEKHDDQPSQARGRLLFAQHDHRQHRQADGPLAGKQQLCPRENVHLACATPVIF